MVMVEGHLSSESWTIRGLHYQIAEWNKDCAYWICKQQAERDCSMWENAGELYCLQKTGAIGGEGRAGNTWQCSSSAGEVWDYAGQQGARNGTMSSCYGNSRNPYFFMYVLRVITAQALKPIHLLLLTAKFPSSALLTV